MLPGREEEEGGRKEVETHVGNGPERDVEWKRKGMRLRVGMGKERIVKRWDKWAKVCRWDQNSAGAGCSLCETDFVFFLKSGKYT